MYKKEMVSFEFEHYDQYSEFVSRYERSEEWKITTRGNIRGVFVLQAYKSTGKKVSKDE